MSHEGMSTLNNLLTLREYGEIFVNAKGNLNSFVESLPEALSLEERMAIIQNISQISTVEIQDASARDFDQPDC